MSLILNNLSHAECVITSFTANFTSEERLSLILVKRFQLEVYNSIDGPLINPLKLSMGERIVAANHIRPSGLDRSWILVLTELNRLHVYGTNEGQFVLIQILEFKSVFDRTSPVVDLEAQAVAPIAVLPILEVDYSQRYVLVHSCQEFLVILELPPSKTTLFEQALRNNPPSQVKRRREASKLGMNKIFEAPLVVSIGSNPVHGVKFLQTMTVSKTQGGATFALISRDSNLRYSLSYYVVRKTKTIEVDFLKRMPQMSSNPSLCVPLPYGNLLVICEDIQYFYPSPSVNLLISTAENARVFRQFCSKGLVSEHEGKLSKMVCYQILAQNRILLCSETGDWYIVQIDLDNEDLVREEEEADLPIASRVSEAKKERIEVAVLEWKTAKVGNFFAFHSASQVSSDTFVVASQYAKIGRFQSSKLQNVEYLSTFTCEPVTAMVKMNHELVYASGTYSGSKMNWKGLEIDGMVKEIVQVGESNLLVVSETRDINLETETEDMVYSMTLYDGHLGHKIGEYRFPIGVTVSHVTATEELSYYHDDSDRIADEEHAALRQDLKSCIVVTIPDAGDDYEYEEDEISKLELFSLDDFKLLATTKINRSANLTIQLNARDLLVLGPNCLLWSSLSVYKEKDECRLRFTLNEGFLQLPYRYICRAEKIGTDLIVADSFNGLYHLKLATSMRKLVKTTNILKNVMVSQFRIVGDDKVFVADVLGNFYMFFVHGGNLSLVHQCNTMRGAIMAMYTDLGPQFPLDRIAEETKAVRLCHLGTAEGALIEVIAIGDSLAMNSIAELQTNLSARESHVKFELPLLAKKTTFDVSKSSMVVKGKERALESQNRGDCGVNLSLFIKYLPALGQPVIMKEEEMEAGALTTVNMELLGRMVHQMEGSEWSDYIGLYKELGGIIGMEGSRELGK